MFSKATLGFLDQLAANNERAWFEENKPRYEALVREPALEFIAAMAAPLAKFAPHFRAEPRKMGGSLMRVFRDTRFARDKSPYNDQVSASSSATNWARTSMRRVSTCTSRPTNASSAPAAGIPRPMRWRTSAT